MVRIGTRMVDEDALFEDEGEAPTRASRYRMDRIAARGVMSSASSSVIDHGRQSKTRR